MLSRHVRSAPLIVVIAILLSAAFLTSRWAETGLGEGSTKGVTGERGLSMPLDPNASQARPLAETYELHGIAIVSGRLTAWIAPHGARPQVYAIGEEIAPGVTLEAIAPRHVVLASGAERIRLDLPPRLGGSGDPVAPAEQGLRPDPHPPTGERSGSDIAAAQERIRGPAPAPLTPEELGTATP